MTHSVSASRCLWVHHDDWVALRCQCPLLCRLGRWHCRYPRTGGPLYGGPLRRVAGQPRGARGRAHILELAKHQADTQRVCGALLLPKGPVRTQGPAPPRHRRLQVTCTVLPSCLCVRRGDCSLQDADNRIGSHTPLCTACNSGCGHVVAPASLQPEALTYQTHPIYHPKWARGGNPSPTTGKQAVMFSRLPPSRSRHSESSSSISAATDTRFPPLLAHAFRTWSTQSSLLNTSQMPWY